MLTFPVTTFPVPIVYTSVVCYIVRMLPQHNRHTDRDQKSRTNVSIRTALLEEARARGIPLSPLLEQALEQRLRQIAEHEWLAENRDTIADYNEYVAEHGTFSKGLRRF